MPSRRYYTAILPVQHINGKLAPIRVKCPNTYDPEGEKPLGFMYGYKRKKQPHISRFGFRDSCRNLNTHPYTTSEQESRDLFTSSIVTVHEHMKIAEDWKLCLVDFNNSSGYVTPIGYAIAACRANGGQWLPEWTHQP